MHYRLWTPCTTYLNNPGCNADNDTIRVDFAKGLRVTVLGASASHPLQRPWLPHSPHSPRPLTSPLVPRPLPLTSPLVPRPLPLPLAPLALIPPCP